jgi:hypothetical protein
MISGRDALAQIEAAISSKRSDEAQLDAALASAVDEAARARAAQVDAYRALARVHLDTLAENSAAVGALDWAEKQALAIVEEQKRTLAEIVARRKEAAASLAAGQSRRHEAAGRLEQAIDRIRALTEKTRARVANDLDWRAADAEVAEARGLAERADAKAKQAETDRATKGAPYEADRLFTYLWRNGWGTSKYAGSGLVKALDAKVARIAAFDQARPSYALLIEIPLRLRAHADRLAADLKEVTAKRTAIERRALEADGIVALETEFAKIKAEIDAGNADLASVQSDLAGLDASHGALVGGETAKLTDALDKVAESLRHQDLQTLYARAYQTPTPDDEKIVRRIEELGNAIARADAEVARLRTTIRTTAEHRGELEVTRDRFRREGWDRPGVSFGNESAIGNIVGGVVGSLIGNVLWSALTSGVQLQHGWRRGEGGFGGSFGGGPNVPGDWGGSGGSSGGFGGDGGGFSTGGGFGGDGGDNSTGGGF